MVDPIDLVYTKAAESATDTARGLYDFIPNIFVAIIILIVGVLIGKIIKKIAVKLLYRFGMGRATRTSGFDATLKKIGYHGTAVELIGDLLKFTVWFVTLAAVANVLMLEPLVVFFQGFTLLLPKIIISIFIIVVGVVLTDFLSKFVQTALTIGTNSRKEKNMTILGKVAESITKLVMFLLIIILIFNIIGISFIVLDIALVISLVTVAGLVLIGAKEVVPNFIAGIYLQKTYEQGDSIKIKDSKGKIVEMNTLFTVLEQKDKKITLPNDMLLNEIVEKEN
ncbi:hypothetical protein CL614_04335 [archaeon]|nr:hypothetical protein [archaeon]|tara:strand:+ start:2618 stop:3460 length:843 start_codon:yes stop_codon:yes gene_type:complete